MRRFHLARLDSPAFGPHPARLDVEADSQANANPRLPPHFFPSLSPERRPLTKYIFPGGELDHIGHTCEAIEKTGFEVHDVEDWREHYHLTTRFWCQRLAARRDEAIALVGPERFRLWLAYLAGVSFAFLDGSARIYQVVASKHATRGRAELPPTRADLYRRAG